MLDNSKNGWDKYQYQNIMENDSKLKDGISLFQCSFMPIGLDNQLSVFPMQSIYRPLDGASSTQKHVCFENDCQLKMI